MRFRPLCSFVALCLVVLSAGCCHDRWCCRHPFAPRCRSECCPPAESCGCCNPCGFPPAPMQTVPPPAFVAPVPH
jgi:hypothetical protein